MKALLEEGSDANADAASSAELYRLAGELDEKLGDPLGAVRELEHAVRLEPSEANYFAWGSELLLHRAIWQAVEVFESGLKAYPKSARIETALGTALFAGALWLADYPAARIAAFSVSFGLTLLLNRWLTGSVIPTRPASATAGSTPRLAAGP